MLDQHRQLVRDTLAGRTLLNALPMPAWFRDAAGRIQWVNEAYVRAVETASEGEVRERQIELLEMRQREAAAAALAKGIPFRERVHLISGGTRKAHDVVVIPLEGASVGAAIDVAALETAQGELVRHVAAYERTLDRVATGVAIFGPDQRLTFFNEAYRTLWQLDADWLATKPSDGELLDRLRELSRLPEVVNYRDWKAKILSGYKTGSEYEDWWHLLDGRTIHVVSAQRPDGGLTYLYDDATERIALESRYNALIGVQRETLDSLKEGVAVFATDGRLKLFNSAFLQIWRLSRSNLEEGPHIDKIIAQASGLYDDMATWARISRTVTGISDRRQPVAGQMIRPDQSVIDFAVSPLPDGATLITYVDVTDSKRYEQTLIERNEALVAADRLKSQFISHVSYELRTPLTNIIGFSELLANPRTGELNSKQREYLADISASSRTLLAIINDILDLATIDAGALELKLAPVRVAAIVDTAVLGVRDRANRARLNLDIHIAEDAVEFVADESRVRQVLYNLLANAIGFSKPGDSIDVSVWRESGMMAFAVEDKGVGIPKDQQQRVLERFESRSQGSKHRGAGLGLSIVKSLVELHGGAMTLESEPGRGTRVTVRFPESGLRQPEPALRGPARMSAEWTWRLDEAGVVRLAELVALQLRRGDVLALRGDLGAGKTTFARALIAALMGEAAEVPSPTFSFAPELRDAAARGGALRLLPPRLGGRSPRARLRGGGGGAARCSSNGRSARSALLPDSRIEIELAETADPLVRRVTMRGLGRCEASVARIGDLMGFLEVQGRWSGAHIAYLQGDASTRGYARLTARGRGDHPADGRAASARRPAHPRRQGL